MTQQNMLNLYPGLSNQDFKIFFSLYLRTLCIYPNLDVRVQLKKRKLSLIMDEDTKLYLPKVVLYEEEHVEELGFPFVSFLSDKQEVQHVGAYMLS
jgi:hypothetical protein